MTKITYITTAIEYANGDPHLGHAFEKIGADALARFARLTGAQVHLLVGSDEHGQKVAQAARASGRTPQAQADAVTAVFRDTWDRLGISYTHFVRTTDTGHALAVADIINRILACHPSDFYERTYTGAYCVGCEAFKTEGDLVQGACPLHAGRALDVVSETNWFFRLSAYAAPIRAHLEAHPDFIVPAARRAEVLALLDRGLDDISITRARQPWGLPFPHPTSDGVAQTLYVWFDALPCYLSALGFPDATWKDVDWGAALQIVGKDITRFHVLLWPAILLAAGLPLPGSIWAHGFVSVDGARLSKSAGVWVDLEEARLRHGTDALRYFLLREVPFDGDGDFSWARFDARYRADLANTLGNLVGRVTTLAAGRPVGAVSPAVGAGLQAALVVERSAWAEAFHAHDPRGALDAVFRLLEASNRFITISKPWAGLKTPEGEPAARAVLDLLVRVLAECALLLSPVLPERSQAIWSAVGGAGLVVDAGIEPLDCSGWVVRVPEPLFPR